MVVVMVVVAAVKVAAADVVAVMVAAAAVVVVVAAAKVEKIPSVTDAMKVATLHAIAAIADLTTNAIRVVRLATLPVNARPKFATSPRCSLLVSFEEKIFKKIVHRCERKEHNKKF